MKHRIRRISVHQTSLTLCIVYTMFCIFMLPLYVFAASKNPDKTIDPNLVVVLPILYGALAYIGTAIFCWLYNFIAPRVGGIELEFAEARETPDSEVPAAS